MLPAPPQGTRLVDGKESSEVKPIKCRTPECASLKNHLGIEATPVRSDLLEWVAKIKGLEDTLWEGGALSVSLYFYDQPRRFPPRAVFNTVPVHPNVDKDTGEVCISFLHTGNTWDPNSAFSILRFIQHILSYPVLEDPINLEAAEMFLKRPHIYREVVEQCVKASQALEREATDASPNHPLRSDRFVLKISFEEYLQAWTKIATSKEGPRNDPNESLDKLVSFAQVFPSHCGSPTQKLIPYTEACLETIKNVMYGPPQKHQRKMRQKEDKLKQIQQMRKLYQLHSLMEPQQDCPAAPPATVQGPGQHEYWETEVDRLVAWTHTLSLEQLNEDP
ncbi:ubiquitin-conjugating enzyme E2 U-like isoform X2 [Alosa sapidissima]|uniref:ubiquitin-conjugating enzyme E2 U-like isoform X2 n=1 Tax=Alosa sapidissima TaxID=34773 RepID=UPI001C090A27|nr:ubiquitin-conjugating enzyme E2 U-like isoform X2 [Alosa sapidissima]